jgi:CRP-like cAMP-binding protein
MVNQKLLKNLVPLHNLSEGNLKRLANKLTTEELPNGTVICREGERNDYAIYLLEGGVELSSQATTMKRVLQGGTEEASYPLANSLPRQFTVTTTTKAKVIRIDTRKLDRAVVLNELTTTITSVHGDQKRKLSGNTEWLEEMLSNKVFNKLPRAKITPLMLRMEVVSIKPGHVVFKQGDPGDYYYVVKRGRFNISRKEPNGRVKIVGELNPGSVFGAEALISGQSRDSSIVAMSDGSLMRLSKHDFTELLKAPLLTFVTGSEAQQMMKKGAGLLDVRAPVEYRAGALRGSVNMPVSQLGASLGKLDPQQPYILCCTTGVQSEVAAFLLAENGFDVYVLKGGLQGMQT